MTETIFRYIKYFFVIILIFSLGMLMVYLIPNDALEPQYSKSIAQLDKEETYAIYLFDTDASILDNFMDRLMILTCHVSDSYPNRIQAAFDNNGYPRYWNGYLLTLRPLLSQFTYQQIRYLNMCLLLILFCFCFSGIHQQYSAVMAFGFALSMIFCFLVLIGESLQYFSVFMILFSLLLILLYIPCFRKPENALLLLFIDGMLTNFFDMLTAPLLTLGIPLVLILAREYDLEKSNIGMIGEIILHALTWGLGYGLTWAAKWALGTVILGKNIFTDAMTTARFRVEGSEAYPLDRGLMFRLNFETYFFAKGHKPLIFTVLILLVLILLSFRFHRKSGLKKMAAILTVGFFPYIWYFIFANHSQLHYFYTYRIQAITLFSLFAAIGCVIDIPSIQLQFDEHHPKQPQ